MFDWLSRQIWLLELFVKEYDGPAKMLFILSKITLFYECILNASYRRIFDKYFSHCVVRVATDTQMITANPGQWLAVKTKYIRGIVLGYRNIRVSGLVGDRYLVLTPEGVFICDSAYITHSDDASSRIPNWLNNKRKMQLEELDRCNLLLESLIKDIYREMRETLKQTTEA